jgi:hypothetical protein
VSAAERWRRRILVLVAALGALAIARALAAPDHGLTETRRPPGGAQARVEPDADGGLLRGPVPDGSGPGLEASYRGRIRIRRPGTYAFELAGSGEAQLRIDGRPVARPRRLEPGLHRIELHATFAAGGPPPELSVRWAKDVPIFEPLPARVLYPEGVAPWRLLVSRGLGWAAVLVAAWLAAVTLASVLGRQRSRRLAFAAVAIVGSTAVALLAIEGAFRLVGIEPPEHVPADVWLSRWWRDPPGPNETLTYSGWLPLNVKEFEVEVAFNRWGWRDRNHDLDKPPGTYRIVVIGDSYVEAKEVRLEDGFPRRLEAGLRERLGADSVEVVALGQGGTGTRWQLQFLRDPGLSFDPDLVVLGFFPGNDILENSDELGPDYLRWLDEVYKPYVIAPKIAIHDRLLIFEGSWLNRFVVDRALRLYTRYAHLFHAGLEREDLIYGTEVYRRGPDDAVWREAWERTEGYVVAMRDLATAHGAEFLVVLVHSIQVPGFSPDAFLSGTHGDLDLLEPARRVRELCEREGIEVVDLEPALTRHLERTGERYYWRYDAHWNETGHRIAAEVLVEALAPRVGEASGAVSGGGE